MPPRAQRSTLLQDLTRTNPWWTNSQWEAQDQQLVAAARAPFELRPVVLDDITPPNLYTLRGPRRVGKSTVLKQTVARLITTGVDPRRICFFAVDSLTTFQDIINLFQTARLLFPDLGETPRYFLLDEVTSIPDWQRGIKWVRDNTPVAGDCVVVSGSSASDVGAGTAYLAGRRGPAVRVDRLLLPLSFPEFVRCAGFSLPRPPRMPFDAFYEAEGREAFQEALVHLGTLVDAFETYLLVGGFPQAVADFRRTAAVSDGFARDLWDVIQSDLRDLGISRPEQCLRLLERIAVSLTSMVALRSLGSDLDAAHPTVGTWLDRLANAYTVLVLFQEASGVADLRRQRKVYPIDPFLARLPARLSPDAFEPEPSRLAEAALATAIFRSLEGNAVDRFGEPSRLFYYRSRQGAEVDLLVLPERRVAESKYVDTASLRETRAMTANFVGGLLLTRSAVDFKLDLQGNVVALPAAVFAWLLDQVH